MEQVLKNMAMLELLNFCREHKIDCSGTYCVKDGRGFNYKLVDQETGQRTIARVTLHKAQAPTFSYYQVNT